MQFRTEYKPSKALFSINHSHRLFFIGSCFTNSFGEWLQEFKFNTELNPFGITFNSISITNQIEFIIQKKVFSENDLFQHQNLFKSFQHHSSFNNANSAIALEKINQRIVSAHEFLKKSDYLFLTLGTSWCYFYKEKKCIVNNCHKIDSKQFERKFISLDQNLKAFETTFQALAAFNPNLKIIFTVSPVRHLKDGLTENQISKATLLLSISELIKRTNNCYYFPAYEIMLDDLRDYRFYANDMIHPNDIAINYIKEIFSEMYFDLKTKSFTKEYSGILSFNKHRPFEEDSDEYKKSKESIVKKQLELEQRFNIS